MFPNRLNIYTADSRLIFACLTVYSTFFDTLPAVIKNALKSPKFDLFHGLVAVMFTFSFSTAFAATTADEALAQALASAKTSAVQSLNNFVNLTDYDAEGQAEVKELVEEGTMLINLQTEVSGVTSTLSTYQTKLLGVANANATALAAAKKAAKESIEDYAEALEATGMYAVNAFDKIVTKYNKAKGTIDNQQVVIGVELMTELAYGEIEEVKMVNTQTDAEVAKALAEAKVAAIKVVKGDKVTDAWATINEEAATADQIAAYKTKVNEVVAAIKAAETTTALAKYTREKAEVEALAAKTEIAAAQSKVTSAVYNWAHDLDWAAYTSDYATIKAAVAALTFPTGNPKAYIGVTGFEWVTDADGAYVFVEEMDDVEEAITDIEAFILKKITTAVNAQSAALRLETLKGEINTAVNKTVITQTMLLEAVRNLETATSTTDLAAKEAAVVAEWTKIQKANDATYAAAIKTLEAYIATYKADIEATNSGWKAEAANAAAELLAAVLADAQADRNYTKMGDGTWNYANTISVNQALLGVKTNGTYAANSLAGATGYAGEKLDGTAATINKTSSYATILEVFQDYLADYLDTVNTSGDAAYTTLETAQMKAVKAAKTITEAYAAFDAGMTALTGYETAAATYATTIAQFKAFKDAEAAVLALPSASKVTLADTAAVDAAKAKYELDKNVYVDAYEEKYGEGNTFIGETSADAKLDAIASALTGLGTKLQNFKNEAFATYLAPTAYAKYTAEQQVALTAAYNAAVAAIQTAAETGYANDVDYVIEDAKTELADIATKAFTKEMAKLIADAKAALATTYNAAEYSAEGLAKIAEILSTLDTATSKKAVATKTVAARKAIAAVDETLEAEALAAAAEKATKIASVEGLKIKASSKAGKGWIKVQWKVTGNTDYVEGYQLYKSTKAQTGYKKCITTTKTSFKNTKNLKKGTRYFYKVRAFVTVDDVKYYSDWSNKANRYAK